MKNNSSFIRQIYNRCLFASLIALLCGTLGSIANSLIVGNIIGAEKLSVVGLVVPIYYIFATAGNLLGIGGSTVASMRMGKNDFTGAKKVFVSTYLLLIISSAVFTVLTLAFLPQIVTILGATPELYEDTIGYASVMAIGGVFTGGIYLSFNFLRLDGRSASSFIVFILMAVVNIAADVIFVFFADLGMVGVSLATTLGAATATLFGAAMLIFKPNVLGLSRLSMREFLSASNEIIKIGSPGAIENIAILAKSFFVNRIVLIGYGALAMSALTVTSQINSFAVSIIAGVAGTIVPFVGVFGAERDTVSIRQVLKLALIQGTVMIVAFSALCIAFATEIATLFGMGDPVSLSFAVPAIRIFCLSLLGTQINDIFISLHLSNGRTALSNLITALHNAIIIIPAVYFLSGYTALGLDGVWHAYWVTELVTFILAIICQLYISSRDKRLSRVYLLDDSAERDGTYISFSVANSEESVMESVEKISDFCEANSLSSKNSMLISLSLEEMLNLIRVHCFGDNKDLTVNTRILLYDGSIILRLRNGGIQFNPLQYYKDIMNQDNSNGGEEEDNLDAMLELGDSLGIKMILDTTDLLDYRRTFGVNNLTIKIDNSADKSKTNKKSESISAVAADNTESGDDFTAESKGNSEMPDSNTMPGKILNVPKIKVKIEVGDRKLTVSSLCEEDIGEVAALYRGIQINKSNYRQVLSSTDELSFNKHGGMFLIFDEEALRGLLSDRSSLMVTARDDNGELVSSIWFSLSDPHFEDKESIYFFDDYKDLGSLIGADATVIGRELIISKRNTVRHVMQYANAVAQRFLYDLGYRDALAEIYGATGYRDAEGEVKDEVFNERSYHTILKFNGEYIGNFRPRNIELDGFSVTIESRAYHWRLDDSVALLEKCMRDDGAKVEWEYGR